MYRQLEDALRFAWTVRRKPLESFMLPAAALEGRFICRDGSLVSLFRLDGSRTMMGAVELDRFVDVAARRLNARFTAPGHAVHIVFERSPDDAALQVDAACARQRVQGDRLGLHIEDLLSERAARLAPLLAAESIIVACWTRPSVLTRLEAQRDRKQARRRLKAWLPDPGESQCPAAGFESLAARHEALLDTFSAWFDEAGHVADRLDEASAAAQMRRLLNGPASTPVDWHPVTVANDAPPRATEPPEDGAFPPPLAPQLLVRDPERAGRGIRIGERLYGPVDMCLGMRQARPFAELVSNVAAADLPLRFSLLLEGGGLANFGAVAARISSSFLAFSSDDSLALRDAMREVSAAAADAEAVVRLRLGLLTWVDAEAGEDALMRRVSRVQQLAEGWGESVFSPLVGDPLEAFAGSVPGFCCGGTAEPAYAPLTDALRLIPASRPAALARSTVNHVFRSPDGKLLPYSCEEGEDYGFELIYGVPGRGKSVLSNCLALAHLLQGGQARLPLAATIDIGPSSSGLISLIREALPPARQAEAGWFRLRMDPASAINPCDTLLGCRRPLPAERTFLENLLSLMLTPAGDRGVPDGMRELIGPTIDVAYRMRADDVAGAEPAPYTPGRDPAVDEALDVHGCRLPETPLWWDVVDELFAAGAPAAAIVAQRYAVPVLSDFLAAVRDPSVQGIVADTRYGAGGESVTQAFVRMMTAYAARWPIIFAPTAFDIGNARVAAVDLAEIAPSGSAEADIQTAVFYMLARQALTRDWWASEEDADQIPERYRDWHAERFRALRETPKRLSFDEYHRTAAAPAVQAQVERDVREARKLRVRIALASQRLEDFGPALVELANRFWVLGAGGKAAEIETLTRTFGLSAACRDAIEYELTGPGPRGAPALLISNDQGGRFEQVVVNSPGPIELWALNTSPPDVALRNRVAEYLPPAAARSALARRFPSGSAREAITAELRQLEARGTRTSATERDVLDRLAAEVAGKATEPFPAGMTNQRKD